MTNPRFTAIAAASVGLLIGGAVGYKVAERRLNEQYDARLLKETEMMRVYYEQVKKPFATPEEAAAHFSEERDKVLKSALDELSQRQDEKHRIAYHQIVQREYQKSDEEPEPEDRVTTPPEDPAVQNLFDSAPQIISQEEYMQNADDWIQSTLTYYREDNALADERDSLLDNVNEIVGLNNLTRFGEGSSDPTTLHIKNTRLDMLFEVILHEGSFSREILGEEPSEPRPSGRTS